MKYNHFSIKNGFYKKNVGGKCFLTPPADNEHPKKSSEESLFPDQCLFWIDNRNLEDFAGVGMVEGINANVPEALIVFAPAALDIVGVAWQQLGVADAVAVDIVVDKRCELVGGGH